MDEILPGDVATALEAQRQRNLRHQAAYSVVADGQSHPIVHLGKTGFVIEADGRPPLRGYADIMRGDDRILRGLVVCTWARNGHVGYEFKRDGTGTIVPADYVMPAHTGLLDAPS
ncbi:MAG: hypothetical protein AAF557_07630 [Pseudomonadota bacterium]